MVRPMHEHSGTVVMDPGSYYEWMFPGISLKRKNVLVKCLLHNDRTPSLSIDTETGRFYCHGCGQSGGDVIDFHQRLNPGMTYREAVAEISGGTRRNSSLNQIVDDIAKRGRHDIYVDDQYMGTVGDYDYANTEGAL